MIKGEVFRHISWPSWPSSPVYMDSEIKDYNAAVSFGGSPLDPDTQVSQPHMGLALSHKF